jgi:flagellar M-ring protein FliF
MRRLEQLAQAAVGFDVKRGDQVVVENVSFNSNGPAVKTPLMERIMEATRDLLRSQPGLGRMAIAGICGVLLILFVLRPVSHQMTTMLREPALLGAGAKTDEQTVSQAITTALTEDELEQPAKAKALQSSASYRQGVFDQVAEHIRREPAQSTRLLEAWIGSQEETE